MTIEHELATWANARPPWQREVIRDLCSSKPISDDDIKAIAASLIEGNASDVPDLTAADMPGGQGTGDPVNLLLVSEAQRVNALLEDQELTFGTPAGLTVIYGDNASGKSGYARVIKASVGALHQAPVLSDVFEKGASVPQQATIKFVTGTAHSTITWPDEVGTELKKVQFYDEACGDAYLGGTTELTYRPSALTLLDRLIAVCDRVRSALDRKVQENGAARGALPAVPPESGASAFLSSLSATTSSEQIDVALRLPGGADEELAKLINEEQRLRATDPAKERRRHETIARKLTELARHVESTYAETGSVAIERLAIAKKRVGELRAAAEVASSKSFDDEAVKGVGTETWRSLWQAARTFSETEAYHEHAFPFTGRDARCVLCHQVLAEDAAARLDRFEAFMRDETEQEAAAAERNLASHAQRLRLHHPMPPGVVTILGELQSAAPELIQDTRAWLSAASDSKAQALGQLEAGEDVHPAGLPELPLTNLRDAATTATKTGAEVHDEAFTAQLQRVVSSRADLEGRVALANGRNTIEAEIARLKSRATIEHARRATDTGAITRKAAELTRSHVTTLVRDQFTRETDRLRLERITLADVGSQKGHLRHRPALLGAAQTAEVAEVFSEGEQTALGLAGFFTECRFDATKSAMILDDPVTSLDHIRRGRVAQRLAEFAMERQVVVFTHDVSFVGDLRRTADAAGAGFIERSVQRRGDGAPGVLLDQHPWKARDVKARFNELERRLAEIKKERPNWNQDQYEEKCADWGGKLSETWERLINVEIVNRVVDRATSEVRVKSFRLFAKITADDDREFQESYGRCSTWARRHDKAEERNVVAPEPDDLEQELAFVRGWFERVRKYI